MGTLRRAWRLWAEGFGVGYDGVEGRMVVLHMLVVGEHVGEPEPPVRSGLAGRENARVGELGDVWAGDTEQPRCHIRIMLYERTAISRKSDALITCELPAAREGLLPCASPIPRRG